MLLLSRYSSFILKGGRLNHTVGSAFFTSCAASLNQSSADDGRGCDGVRVYQGALRAGAAEVISPSFLINAVYFIRQNFYIEILTLTLNLIMFENIQLTQFDLECIHNAIR